MEKRFLAQRFYYLHPLPGTLFHSLRWPVVWRPLFGVFMAVFRWDVPEDLLVVETGLFHGHIWWNLRLKVTGLCDTAIPGDYSLKVYRRIFLWAIVLFQPSFGYTFMRSSFCSESFLVFGWLFLYCHIFLWFTSCLLLRECASISILIFTLFIFFFSMILLWTDFHSMIAQLLDGVRKEKERLTAAGKRVSREISSIVSNPCWHRTVSHFFILSLGSFWWTASLSFLDFVFL